MNVACVKGTLPINQRPVRVRAPPPPGLGEGMGKSSKGALGRLASLGGLTSRVTSSYVGQRIAGAFQDAEGRREALDRLHLRNAERVVETVGRLKGAAMKVGQSVAMVAGSLDLPEDVRGVLGKLHDKVEPIPFAQIREDVEAALGRPLTDSYSWFDPQPLGTASLGQAHAARLPDGRDVVVKVLHRGVEGSVSSDIGALKAMLVGGRLLKRDKAEIDAMFEEIRERLAEELDYLQEAANIAEFQRMFAGDDRVRIPGVHHDWCSERVLTMDRLPGLPLETFLERATPEARQRAGVTLVHMFYSMIYTHLTLHADPHPGNYLFELDGRVGLLDFGCVRRFDPYWMAHYAQAAMRAVARDRDGCLAHCEAIGAIDEKAPSDAREALWHFCDLLTWPYRVPEYELGGPADDELFRQFPLAIARLVQHREIHSTRELLFMHRALGGMYALQRRLRPKAAWVPILEPYVNGAIERVQGL